MARRLGARGALLVTLLLAFAAASALHRLSPPALVDSRRGSEDAFASGLEPREIEDGALARRWAGRRATPLIRQPSPRAPRPARRSALATASRGGRPGRCRAGNARAGRDAGRYSLAEPRGGRVDLELLGGHLRCARGTALGFLLDRVQLETRARRPLAPVRARVDHGPARRPRGSSSARWAGLEAAAATWWRSVCWLCTWPALYRHGLVRSPYSRELGFWLVMAALGALSSRAVDRSARGLRAPRLTLGLRGRADGLPGSRRRGRAPLPRGERRGLPRQQPRRRLPAATSVPDEPHSSTPPVPVPLRRVLLRGPRAVAAHGPRPRRRWCGRGLGLPRSRPRRRSSCCWRPPAPPRAGSR